MDEMVHFQARRNREPPPPSDPLFQPIQKKEKEITVLVACSDVEVGVDTPLLKSTEQNNISLGEFGNF
jgi:hypothetical protein